MMCVLVVASPAGCILFEDTDNIEAVDVSIGTDATTQDTGGEDVATDVNLNCAPDNPSNCGTSGGTCVNCMALAGVSTASCTAGVCAIDTCSAGLQDCDGNVQNGCEAQESPQRCGPLCQSCLNLANTTGGECSEGACVPICVAGKLDCDGSAQTGCEADEGVTQCGAACEDCTTLPGVKASTSACGDGACAFECAWGFLDCEEAQPGCETPFRDTACGADCSLNCETLPNVETGRCAGDKCAILKCRDGYSNADGQWQTGCENVCDLGECWTESLPVMSAVSFLDDGMVGVAVGADGLILYTDDGGDNWSRRESGVEANLNIIGHNGNDVFIALGDENLMLRSDDQGLSWTPVLFLPPGGATPVGVAGDGELMFVYGNGLLMRSRDGGQSWPAGEDISSQIGTMAVRAIGIRGDEVFVGGSGGQVYLSQDRTETALSPVPQTLTTSTIRFFNFTSTAILAGGSGFLIQSTNIPVWSQVPGIETQSNWISVSVDESDSIFLLEPNGYAIRPAGATTFTQVSGVGATREILVGATIREGEGTIVGYSSGIGHVFRTNTDDDETTPPYTPQPSVPTQPQAADEVSPSIPVEAMTFPGYTNSWVVEDGDVLLMGGGTGYMVRSGDNGATWSRPFIRDASDRNAFDALPVIIAELQGQAAFVGTPENLLLYSKDAGQTWIQSLSSLNNSYVSADMDEPNVATTGSQAGVPVLYTSNSGGLGQRVRNCKSNTDIGSCTELDLIRDPVGIAPVVLTISVDVVGDQALVGSNIGEVIRSDGEGGFGLEWYTVFDTINPLFGGYETAIEDVYFNGTNMVLFTGDNPTRIFSSDDADTSDGVEWLGYARVSSATGATADTDTFSDESVDFVAAGVTTNDFLVIDNTPGLEVRRYQIIGGITSTTFDVTPEFNDAYSGIEYRIVGEGQAFPKPAPEGETSRATDIRDWEIMNLNGAAVGAGGFIAISNDAGLNWDEVFIEGMNYSLSYVAVEDNNIVAADTIGNIVYSTDAGATWSEARAPVVNGVRGLSVQDGRAILIGGTGQVLFSHEGL